MAQHHHWPRHDTIGTRMEITEVPVTSGQVAVPEPVREAFGITEDRALQWNNPRENWGEVTTAFTPVNAESNGTPPSTSCP